MGITLEEKAEYIPLTPFMRDRLNDLKKQKGCGPFALYSFGRANTDHNIFHNTEHTTIRGWMNGETKSAHPKDYQAIISTYEILPDKLPAKQMAYTAK